MNKLGIIGVSLVAAASMGGGMLLTGAASASSTSEIGPVQADPASDAPGQCVYTDSAMADTPEGEIAIADVGEPVASFEMDPGSTWQSVSIDADGNITTEQGTDAEMPTVGDTDAIHSARSLSDSSSGAGIIVIPESDIHVGGPCNP